MRATIRAIDLFAGGGGFTTGATHAGISVVWAANHWPKAVDCHSRNHPRVEHVCQDLHQANWSRVPSCDLVLASPCCQGHTKSRGKERAYHDESRSTAWAVVSCCEYQRPAAFVVENVPEFLDWSLYPVWSNAMAVLGYNLTVNIIDAADVGLPQNRVRLFIVGTRSGSVTIPNPGRRPRTAREIIDFDKGRWSLLAKKGRSPATLARAANGHRRFGERFVMPYYSNGSGLTGRSLDRPLGTVMTGDRWAVVDGDRMRMLRVIEYSLAMGFPEDYWLPPVRRDAIKLLGNAVPPPLAEFVVGCVADHLLQGGRSLAA